MKQYVARLPQAERDAQDAEVMAFYRKSQSYTQTCEAFGINRKQLKAIRDRSLKRILRGQSNRTPEER